MNESLFNITLDNLSGSMMLTIEPKENVVINQFCCEMIKKTNVYGLLKLNVTSIDGNIRFNYDLSKKKSLSEFAKTGFNESYGRRILYNLCSTFLKLNEYYLKPNYCLLSPDYTYIGDGLNVYIPYIPIKDVKSDSNELKQYISELLSRYFAVEGVVAYDEMFKYVYQCQTLDLKHFISKFLASEEQSQNNFVVDKQIKLDNKMPLPNGDINKLQEIQNNNNHDNHFDNNKQKPIVKNSFIKSAESNFNSGINIPGGDNKIIGKSNASAPKGVEFKLPNSGAFKMPNSDNKKIWNNKEGANKSQKEKKGIFGFGIKKQQDLPNQVIQNNNKNQNMPNNCDGSNFVKPQVNSQQKNVLPRFTNGMQGSMDRTIMIDGINSQMESYNNNFTSGAFLQYRGQNIPINDAEFVIGKANDQFKINFAINNNPHVSRKHATIILQGNNFYIRDEGSTNGTYVNGRSLPKMVPQPLQNGDEISIYDEVFRFCAQ